MIDEFYLAFVQEIKSDLDTQPTQGLPDPVSFCDTQSSLVERLHR